MKVSEKITASKEVLNTLSSLADVARGVYIEEGRNYKAKEVEKISLEIYIALSKSGFYDDLYDEEGNLK